MIPLMASGGLALVLAAIFTPLLRRWLLARSVGQRIRDDGPHMHKAKEGTATMGGIALLGAVVAAYLLAHIKTGIGPTRDGLMLIGLVVVFGVIGFLDDLLKVRNKRNLGLNKRAKFIAQVGAAGLYVAVIEQWGHVSTYLSFTRWDSTGLNLGAVGWGIWAVVIIVGASNAVNLTDGLDGLAAGSAAFCFFTLAIIGYWQYRHFNIYRVSSALDLSLIALALAGSCAGFLWWNAAPAKIFMGDTGSLAIGSGLAGLAMSMDLQLLLLIIGGLFVIVTLSVIVQVFAFKVFHRRVFKMAPLHHHFELKGWAETTVIVRFWIVAALFAIFGLGVFYADFISVSGLIAKVR